MLMSGGGNVNVVAVKQDLGVTSHAYLFSLLAESHEDATASLLPTGGPALAHVYCTSAAHACM